MRSFMYTNALEFENTTDLTLAQGEKWRTEKTKNRPSQNVAFFHFLMNPRESEPRRTLWVKIEGRST